MTTSEGCGVKYSFRVEGHKARMSITCDLERGHLDAHSANVTIVWDQS